MSINYKRIEVLVEEDVLKEFKRILIDKDDDMSGLIRQWIKTYLKKKDDKPSIPELKEVMVETEKKYSVHNFGPNGNGVCFNCIPPHKAVV